MQKNEFSFYEELLPFFKFEIWYVSSCSCYKEGPLSWFMSSFV